MNMLPLQAGDVPDTWADIDDLTRDVGYTPATPVEQGIRAFVDWYLEYYKDGSPEQPEGRQSRLISAVCLLTAGRGQDSPGALLSLAHDNPHRSACMESAAGACRAPRPAPSARPVRSTSGPTRFGELSVTALDLFTTSRDSG